MRKRFLFVLIVLMLLPFAATAQSEATPDPKDAITDSMNYEGSVASFTGSPSEYTYEGNQYAYILTVVKQNGKVYDTPNEVHLHDRVIVEARNLDGDRLFVYYPISMDGCRAEGWIDANI